MSVFDRLFKLKKDYKESQKDATLDLLMKKTHYKLSQKEINKLYETISSKINCSSDNTTCIRESMQTLTDLKAEWLTKDEKESFVAGVWLCERATDRTNPKAIQFINNEELNYTKQAILGSSFKAIR